MSTNIQTDIDATNDAVHSSGRVTRWPAVVLVAAVTMLPAMAWSKAYSAHATTSSSILEEDIRTGRCAWAAAPDGLQTSRRCTIAFGR